MLGVCYGAQHLAHKFGGKVLPSNTREYGRANLSFVDSSNKIFDSVSLNSQVWMSHGDTIATLPDNYQIIASTNDVMTMNGGTTGGIVGSWVEFTAIASAKYFVRGSLIGTASVATPFADS